MRSTGIVRKLDSLGRVVLPIDLRRQFAIDPKVQLEIAVDGDCIVLSKHIEKCYICGSAEDVNVFEGKNICGGCIGVAKDLVK